MKHKTKIKELSTSAVLNMAGAIFFHGPKATAIAYRCELAVWPKQREIIHQEKAGLFFMAESYREVLGKQNRLTTR